MAVQYIEITIPLTNNIILSTPVQQVAGQFLPTQFHFIDPNTLIIMPCKIVSTKNRSVFNNNSKKHKRSKNWSDDETALFINIWAEHFDSLDDIRTRKSRIFQLMTEQLNRLLVGRTITSVEVTTKFYNLIAKYRKIKRAMSKTNGYPSSWIHYNRIDKIFTERIFTDDSLMIIEEESCDNNCDSDFDNNETNTKSVATNNKSEMLALFEKQEKLQEESKNLHKEFMNIFKTIANRLNPSLQL